MKLHSKYVCQSCGYESPRWIGRCPNCDTWNSFVEELVEKSRPARTPAAAASSVAAIPLAEVDLSEEQRIVTGMEEFDRVLGGGIVLGSVMLLGGDPGVGKSTLMMQLASRLGSRVVLYVSGEESAKQLKLRAERLNCAASTSFLVLAESNADVVAEVLARSQPELLVIDSIQTMFRPQFESSPGTVAQVRETAALFTRIAKAQAMPAFLIGHVTKEGILAGPKVIEHMVDTVLQFEGERQYSYRVLRSIKNRFGSTNEIGVFEMRDTGLQEVRNPSEVFLSQRAFGASGSTVVASIEGTRPILVEVQALVTPTNYGVPQRTTTGFDYRRLGLLLAVLEKRLGVNVGQNDVFVNIAGGVRVDEPAVDLGIASSILSSLRDRPVDAASVAVGEIGLGGEVRTVSQMQKRVQEAAKLGFRRVVMPRNNLKGITRVNGVELVGIDRIEEAAEVLLSR